MDGDMTRPRDRMDELELLPDESPHLREEIARTIGEEWLSTKNVWLEGKTPEELIGTADEYKVRDIFRSVIVAALS